MSSSESREKGAHFARAHTDTHTHVYKYKDVQAQTSTDGGLPKYDRSGTGPNTAFKEMN